MPYGITQCYLPPAEVTFPPLPQPKLVLDLATPEGCKAELTVEMVYPYNGHPSWTNRARCWLTSLMRPTTLTIRPTPSRHPRLNAYPTMQHCWLVEPSYDRSQLSLQIIILCLLWYNSAVCYVTIFYYSGEMLCSCSTCSRFILCFWNSHSGS